VDFQAGSEAGRSGIFRRADGGSAAGDFFLGFEWRVAARHFTVHPPISDGGRPVSFYAALKPANGESFG